MIGLNVGLLNDLFFNDILGNFPFHILFVPYQPTTMEQPIEVIPQFIGDQQPLVEGQPISFTWMFLQTVTFGFQRNPDVAGNGGSGGRKHVRPIAIDYRTVAGTAGAECKGD